MNKLPLRARLATSVGGAASEVRHSPAGVGSVIGGVIGLRLEPGLLAMLAQDRQVVLVSGTNGKTTTTRLITAALAPLGHQIASNPSGPTWRPGWPPRSARPRTRHSRCWSATRIPSRAVLDATRARVLVLLNLSRDQMDRAAEIWLLARRWREAIAAAPGSDVVANADDPLIAWAACRGAPRHLGGGRASGGTTTPGAARAAARTCSGTATTGSAESAGSPAADTVGAVR